MLGELYINKLLEEKNSSLLEQLNLFDKNIDIICYNKDYNNQKDWEDKSIYKGHDILVKLKDSNEEIYLEVKTSLEDTNFYSMSGNELKFSKEKGENYYIIKISNFATINSDSNTNTLRLYIKKNPYKLLENGDFIKDISLYC